jgi:hypothetical protein
MYDYVSAAFAGEAIAKWHCAGGLHCTYALERSRAGVLRPRTHTPLGKKKTGLRCENGPSARRPVGPSARKKNLVI